MDENDVRAELETLDNATAFRSLAEDMERRGCPPEHVAHMRATADAKEVEALERMRGEPLTSGEYAELWRELDEERLEEVDRSGGTKS